MFHLFTETHSHFQPRSQMEIHEYTPFSMTSYLGKFTRLPATIRNLRVHLLSPVDIIFGKLSLKLGEI